MIVTKIDSSFEPDYGLASFPNYIIAVKDQQKIGNVIYDEGRPLKWDIDTVHSLNGFLNFERCYNFYRHRFEFFVTDLKREHLIEFVPEYGNGLWPARDAASLKEMNVTLIQRDCLMALKNYYDSFKSAEQLIIEENLPTAVQRLAALKQQKETGIYSPSNFERDGTPKDDNVFKLAKDILDREEFRMQALAKMEEQINAIQKKGGTHVSNS